MSRMADTAALYIDKAYLSNAALLLVVLPLLLLVSLLLLGIPYVKRGLSR